MSYDVSIIGAGLMGHGFALHFVVQDQNVTLIDHREENLQQARERIRETVYSLNELSVIDEDPDQVLDAIEYTTDQGAGVTGADIVLETISEDLSAKQEFFDAVVNDAPGDAILASNTSGLQIGKIAEAIPKAADRFVGCHWWNPPYLMPLVEVVRGPETADDTVERIEQFVETVDRDPIRVNTDVPGIVWNRIQFAVLRECMHLLERDVASLEDINKAVRDGYARRTAAIGPFETVDLSGLDLFRDIAEELYPHLSNTKTPSHLFDEYLKEGRNGVESGAGFFEYDETLDERTEYRDVQLAELARAIANSRPKDSA